MRPPFYKSTLNPRIVPESRVKLKDAAKSAMFYHLGLTGKHTSVIIFSTEGSVSGDM